MPLIATKGLSKTRAQAISLLSFLDFPCSIDITCSGKLTFCVWEASHHDRHAEAESKTASTRAVATMGLHLARLFVTLDSFDRTRASSGAAHGAEGAQHPSLPVLAAANITHCPAVSSGEASTVSGKAWLSTGLPFEGKESRSHVRDGRWKDASNSATLRIATRAASRLKPYDADRAVECL